MREITKPFLIILTIIIFIHCTFEESFDYDSQRNFIYRKNLNQNADPDKWKFITVVTVGRFIICTGVLIRPRWVLSTANCFVKNKTVLPEKFGPLSVRVGPAHLSYMDWNDVSIQNLHYKQIVATVQEDDLISIVKYIIHPRYVPHDLFQVHKNDIGIGQLLREAGDIVAPLPSQPIDASLSCQVATYRTMLPSEDKINNTNIGALQEFSGSPFDAERCKMVLKLLGNKTHTIPDLYLEGKFCMSFGNVSKLEELRDFGMIGAPVMCGDGLHGVSCILTVQTLKADITFHQYVEVFTDFLTHLNWIQKTLKKQGDAGLDLNLHKRKSGTIKARSSYDSLAPPSYFIFIVVSSTVIVTNIIFE